MWFLTCFRSARSDIPNIKYNTHTKYKNNWDYITFPKPIYGL